MKKLILVGASGLVGRHVLAQALMHPAVNAVVAPSRKALPAHPKLVVPRVDFDRLPEDAGWWRADAVICTLGTTMKIAGSQEAFRRVDHDYPLLVAQLALKAGTPVYALNSALGADPRSRFFYNRVKGELEQDLAQLGFASLTCVRPGLIAGARDDARAGERALLSALNWLGPVLPRRWRPNPAERIAAALLQAALEAKPGMHVVMAEQLMSN
ncbi:NAD-dependent dehydratase [Roseateles sp.]|uniref:NAD-dependent dehydratase n=1 Tax=Roseateles sp. TaxID=1971397 RepID=UPI00286D3748|nr:NAD-dependent dehydratase [Roseateles sp.]